MPHSELPAAHLRQDPRRARPGASVGHPKGLAMPAPDDLVSVGRQGLDDPQRHLSLSSQVRPALGPYRAGLGRRLLAGQVLGSRQRARASVRSEVCCSSGDTDRQHRQRRSCAPGLRTHRGHTATSRDDSSVKTLDSLGAAFERDWPVHALGGVPVPCVLIEARLSFHTGNEPDRRDHHDAVGRAALKLGAATSRFKAPGSSAPTAGL